MKTQTSGRPAERRPGSVPAPGPARQGPPQGVLPRKGPCGRTCGTRPLAASGLALVRWGPQMAPAAAAAPGPAEPADPDQEFISSLDSLFRAFRMKAGEVWSRARLNAVCARAVTRLQTNFPGFDPAALAPDTAAAVFDVMEMILDETPWWHRRTLRQEALNLLAELYNTSYDGLRAHAALERVEQLYLSIKE